MVLSSRQEISTAHGGGYNSAWIPLTHVPIWMMLDMLPLPRSDHGGKMCYSQNVRDQKRMYSQSIADEIRPDFSIKHLVAPYLTSLSDTDIYTGRSSIDPAPTKINDPTHLARISTRSTCASALVSFPRGRMVKPQSGQMNRRHLYRGI